MYFKQRTLADTVRCSGVGVHSGQRVNLTIHPAPQNHGIKFLRTDLPDCPCIAAHFNMVVDTSMATVIGYDGFIISTIEHLMASFTGLSIDNALVELDTYEMPIMDGSAGPFTSLIKAAGITELDAPRYFFVINEPIELEKDGRSVGVYPYPSYKITCSIEYDHSLINRQSYTIDLSDQVFESEISRARTFGFLQEYEYFKRYGLAQGVSLENVVVVGEHEIVNEGGLRYENEFVRHKILDCLGDFSLLGMPIFGHVIANKSGHALNHAFLKKFFAQKDSWDARMVSDINDLPA
ncbi:MAG: UDP-3-O-acyl-N-acetylglucosamine deacetylase [Desulfobacterales bacterium]|nr:MAG: UDP-3-O-acyl-N-acetylglucosamine deacetylase [Desulfobacterales bacterium]